MNIKFGCNAQPGVLQYFKESEGMMPILHVRNVPDELYQQLKARAKIKKRSLSAEVTILLEEALQSQAVAQTDLLDGIRQRRFFRPETANAPDSLSLLRENRTR